MSEWSAELPKKPGEYLFYGRFGRPEQIGPQGAARWEICHVGATRTGTLMYSCGGCFLYPGEFTGKFKPLDVAPPDLE